MTALAAVAWTLFLLWGLMAPADSVRRLPIHIWDKAAHFLLFFPFGILWLFALSLGALPGLSVVAAGLALGGLTEIMQNRLTQGRHGDVADFAADALAVISAWVVYAVFLRLRRPK